MKLKTLALGTQVKDRATGITGTLTHLIIGMGGHVDYVFQPPGLNNDNGLPLNRLTLEIERFDGLKQSDFEEIEVPTEIFGSQVSDKASGFNGMAVGFVRHINGCFHVIIQPSGTVKKTGAPVAKMDFDLRQCVGDKIPKLSKPELQKSNTERPSPCEMDTDHFFPQSQSVLSGG